ncbi:calcium-activated potassium channel subunit beta-2 [Girardinichthys multiradiatus]|nr:calcium-activated potassium channel subunit beta-2 [Girardinichthys multiradiatus]
MFFVAGARNAAGSGRQNERSVWTEEGACAVINSTITGDMNCSYSCGSDCWRVSRYPCLQVYVSVNNTGHISRLSHNEETQDASSECVYIPRCQKDSTAMYAVIMNISEHLKMNQHISCYYDPSKQQDTVLLTRLYDHSVVFHSLLWPSCMLSVGALIIVMVKLTQYLSRLCEEIAKIKR